MRETQEENDEGCEVNPELLALADIEAGALQESLAAHDLKVRQEFEKLCMGLEHGVAHMSQQQRYVDEKKHRDALIRTGELAARRATEMYINLNPGAVNLTCTTKTIAMRKKAFNKVDLKYFYDQIIGLILWRSHDFKTQTSILETVNLEFKHAPQSANVWTRKLPWFQMKRIAEFIQCNRSDLNISLAGCKTLADCRQAILLAKVRLTKSHTVKATIVITPSKVLVNKLVFPVSQPQEGTSQGARVRVLVSGKRQWLRVDTVKAFLGIPA